MPSISHRYVTATNPGLLDPTVAHVLNTRAMPWMPPRRR